MEYGSLPKVKDDDLGFFNYISKSVYFLTIGNLHQL